MIRLENRAAVNSVAVDQKRLKNDLKDLKQVLFTTIGVIGIKVIGNPHMLVSVLKSGRLKHTLYHVQNDVYIVVCRDIEKTAFERFCHRVNYDLKSRYDGAISFYEAYGDDEPDPQGMILLVMKLIQANQDTFGLNDEHRTIMDELEKGRYLMFLQPKADSRTGEIVSAEALVRYRSESGSVFPPGRFIPQLEQKGLIYHVDIFMFEQTCRILKKWQGEQKLLYPISLNFSRVTLMHENLIETMNHIQQHYGVARGLIEIEITESVEMMDKKKLKRIAAQIIQNGYRLSLDDFGVSFSNISILSILKFDTLKIDRSIVEDICRNARLQVIIRTLIEMCHELDICVIAEGIETRKQMKTLHQLGCDWVQGYLIGRPVAVEVYEKVYELKKDRVMMNCIEKKQAAI